MSDNNNDEKKEEVKENNTEKKKEENVSKNNNSKKIDYFKTDIEKDENLSKYIDVDNTEKPKYRLNFSKIIKLAKTNSSKFEKYSEIEYNCNICLNSSQIDIANKINAFSLLSFINFNNQFYDNLFYLNNRIIKLLSKDKGIEAFIFIRTLYRASKILFENFKNYFHSYYYLNLAIMIKDKAKIDIDSSKLLNSLMTTLKENTEKYLITKQNSFMNMQEFNSEKINSIKEILNNIGKNNINNDDNIYYVINKNWVDRACNFFNEYERLFNLHNDVDFTNFIAKSFNLNNIYCKYIGEELTNLTIEDSDKNIPFFPGPIDNYSITDFKDFWNETEFTKLQNNYFIKDGLELNKNYYLINKNTWKTLNEIFQSTNEIKRKGNDIDLMVLKCIIFEKNLQKKEYINHLRRKYIQISKKESVYDLKDKILRSINNVKKTYKELILKIKQKDNDYKENTLTYDENDENNNNIEEEINLNKKTIHFFECSYEKKDILSEMIIAYSNSIKSIKYEIQKLDIEESLLMENFPCNGLRKNNNLLLIEIKDENEENFLNENDNKCSECQKEINKETEFKCEKCNLNQYCSYQCSKKNETHNKIHKYLDNFLIEEFSLKKLFQINIQDIVKEESNHGLCGLLNLGNTCFMNSVIQCLSNTEDLTKYFLLDFYEQEMNLGNRFGSSGNLVESYSKLINLLWNRENNNPINPKFFISEIIKKLKQYRYNNQQDAHEFLSLFIDNLHEDINRISNKPYIELKERQENENDEQASYRWWKSHRLRENSIISDLFYGQFKSDIKCLKCNRNSITYDPFMFLGLSLPISSFKIKLKFFYKKNCYSIDFLIWGDCKIFDLKNRCFELNVLKELNIEKNLNLIEAVALNKEKIINSIVKNNEDIVYNYIKEGQEICLFKKDSLDCFNIYCYPVKITSEDSMIFGKSYKINFLSYPIGISINHNTTIENLKNIIYEQLNHMLDSKVDTQNNLFNLYIYHNFKEKSFSFNFFSTKPTCEFCHQRFNQSSPFCNINSQFNNTEILGNIINQFQNNRPLILLFESEYFINESAYINSDMLIKNYIPIPLLENAEKTSLYNSLESFKEDEKLNDNGWYCNKCKEHTQAIKKLNIYRAPNYLIIHLKRFRIRNGIKGQQFGRKNEVFISYPINNFDLSDYVIGPNKKKAIYNLYGVVEHFGSLSQGHYIAKCKNFGKWYLFNDQECDEINDNIVSKNAYLLFYKRKGLENEF